MRRSLPVFFKVAVSVVLLVYLLSRIDVAGLLDVMRSARLSYLVVVLTFYLVSQVASTFRWSLLARAVGFDNPFREFVVYYLIGMFFNLFAPSTVGGDVGRAYYLASTAPRQKVPSWMSRTAAAVSTVVADRAVGMAVMIWMAASALFLFPAYPVPLPVRYLTTALALGLFLGWVLLPCVYGLLRRVISPLGEGFNLAIGTYFSRRQVVVRPLMLSLVTHCIQAVLHVILGWSLDLNIPWSYAFILYPLVGAFSAIPASFNGIGLREGGYLFMLQRIGVSPEKALAFSLLWFTVVVVDSMVGGIVFVFRRKREGVVEAAGNQVR